MHTQTLYIILISAPIHFRCAINDSCTLCFILLLFLMLLTLHISTTQAVIKKGKVNQCCENEVIQPHSNHELCQTFWSEFPPNSYGGFPMLPMSFLHFVSVWCFISKHHQQHHEKTAPHDFPFQNWSPHAILPLKTYRGGLMSDAGAVCIPLLSNEVFC